ncbi:putative CBS domain-containing protein [Magnetospirillum sp. XM-1]|uniref:CBS domain-containing protein n=1 Tax=Magnetospirillum sp. XM-1 TaxID=1663591 RepID=UPI00073DC97E|nr:CBS domain-containing protein [Magnetospirillum sp. XM-1]CUW39822.1 putative CBS domain-containing protein [Magnetospirillum sp. XM-1]
MLVSEILNKKGNKIFKILPSKAMIEAVQGMAAFKVGAVLVVDDKDRTLGIFTERDVTRCLAAHGAGVLESPVGDHMTRDPLTCQVGDTVASVMSTMSTHHFRHMPVMDHGQLKGIVSIRDLVSNSLERAEFEAEALRTYVTAG